MPNNIELVKFAEYMCSVNAPYWFGCYGQIASEKLYREKSAQYPDEYSKWSRSSFENQYGKKVADCSGLFKAFGMTPDVNNHPENPAKYDPKWDLSANMIFDQAKEKGTLDTMPEIKGLVVWKKGHVGCFVGKAGNSKMIIEERGHSYGTVRTRLEDRPFTHWCKHPLIEYIEAAPTPSHLDMTNIALPVLRYGIKDNTVTLLQMCLKDLGYRDQNGNELKIDGDFKEKTDYVVKQFQKDNYPYCGEADGVCGTMTWTRLFSKRYK